MVPKISIRIIHIIRRIEGIKYEYAQKQLSSELNSYSY